MKIHSLTKIFVDIVGRHREEKRSGMEGLESVSIREVLVGKVGEKMSTRIDFVKTILSHQNHHGMFTYFITHF